MTNQSCVYSTEQCTKPLLQYHLHTLPLHTSFSNTLWPVSSDVLM